MNRVAWYDKNSGNKSHRVGTKAANDLGLYDMSGNVWEWVGDWYGDDYYGRSPKNNPKGPREGSGRVIRGGGWFYDAEICRSASRFIDEPGYRILYLGFRLARTHPFTLCVEIIIPAPSAQALAAPPGAKRSRSGRPPGPGAGRYATRLRPVRVSFFSLLF